MNLSGTQLKDTYGNLLTIGTSAGSPQTGTLQNGNGQDITSLELNSNSLSLNGTAPSIYLMESDTTDLNTRISSLGSQLQIRTINDAKSVNTIRLTLDHSSGDISFRDSGASEAFYWDASAGSLGIGNTSPDALLHIGGSIPTSAEALNVRGNSASTYAVSIEQDNSSGYGVLIDTDGTLVGQPALNVKNSSGSMLYVGSNGNVGIGTDSPDYPLTVKVDSATGIKVLHSNDSSVFQVDSFGSTGTDAGALLRMYNEAGDATVQIDTRSGASRHTYFNNGGNVGIGETNPDASFTVSSGTANNVANFKSSDGTAYIAIADNGSTSALHNQIGVIGDDMFFATNDNERLRIDSSGNVGMNAIPENSAGTWRNYQLGSLSMAGRANDSNPDAMFGTNFKFTTANAEQRISADATSRIFFNDDVITFQNAGSDTAGSAISWNSNMTIDSSGNMGIGTQTIADPFGYGNILQVGTTSGNTRLAITAGDANSCDLHFADSNVSAESGTYAGFISYKHDSDDMVFGTATSEAMRILSGGDVSFAMEDFSASPSDTVYGLRLITGATGKSYWKSAVNADTTHYHYEFLNTNGSVGNISTSASATAYNTSSDYRLKENVVALTGALDRIDQLNPSRFNFIADADTTVDGFLAHEVADVVPEAITGEKDAVDDEGNPIYQSIDQSKLVPLLVGAIQELRAEIEQLKNQ